MVTLQVNLLTEVSPAKGGDESMYHIDLYQL